MARRFELVEGTSRKFWEVDLSGCDVTVTFGRIGTTGQSKTKTHGSADEARKEADKLVAEKTKKGYAEMPAGTPVAASAAPPAAPAAAPRAPTAPAVAPTAPAAAPSLVADGTLRFAPPAWVASLAQEPLSAPAPRRKARSFADLWGDLYGEVGRWSEPKVYSAIKWKHASDDVAGVAERVVARLASGQQGEGFDDELEEATYAVSTLVEPHRPSWVERPLQALLHWADRVGPERALRTFLRARRWSFAKTHKSFACLATLVRPDPASRERMPANELLALREALRVFGVAAHAPLVRDDGLGGPIDVAWALEDAALAAELFASAPAQERPKLALLAPLFERASDVREVFAHLATASQYDGDEALVRVVLRHGSALGDLVLARAASPDEPGRRWVAPLACYPSIEAARLLVERLERKPDRKLVGEALASMPAFAVEALREAQGKRTKYRDAIDGALAALGPVAEPSASPSVKRPASGAPLHAAPLDALPPVLRQPPWRQKRKAELRLDGLATLAVPPRIDLRDAQAELARDELASKRVHALWNGPDDELVERLRSRRVVVSGGQFACLPLEEIERLDRLGVLELVNLPFWTPETFQPGLILLLARHGVAVLPYLLRLAPRMEKRLVAQLAYAGAVELAPLAVSWLASKQTRKAASQWAVRFPEHAAAGLLPIALGKPGVDRDRATTLLLAVRAGHAAALVAAGRALGPEAEAAVKALIERDPVDFVPTKPPKLPDGLLLPEVRLRDGRSLPDEARLAVVEMLAFSPVDVPYAGLEQVLAACDPRSLDDLVEALVTAWSAAGMPTAHEWMVRSAALVGGDGAARVVAERVRAWAQENAKQRALLALDVLGAMGSDLALSLVGRASRSGQRQYVKDHATAVLAEVAAARGLSPDELEDRTAPDLGLDDQGTLLLDFGPRAFRVGFDEHLVPFVRTPEGERLTALPRPTKADDAAKAKAASEAWKELKAEAEKVAADQVRRLERMLADERRVEPDVFRKAFVEHPLVGHLARRLVWGVYDAAGKLLSTFRVAEDRSLASAADEAFALPAEGAVGLVHPQHLSGEPALLAQWSQVLADYQVLQPFEQLAREVVVLTAAQITERYAKKRAPSSLLYSLRHHGWRAETEEGIVTGFLFEGGGLRASLDVSPWLERGKSAVHDLTLRVRFEDGRKPSLARRSELVRQLDRVAVE